MSILKKFIFDKSKVIKASIVMGGLAIVAVASIAATTAYLSATTDIKENTFRPYTLTDTQIVEPNGTTYSATDDYVTNKIVEVQNPYGTDKKPVFVRVLATVESNEKDGNYNTFTSITIDRSRSNLNTAYWTYSDGYYYYKYVLYPGYKTQPLFTDGKIYFTESVDKNITLTFTTDTVQAWANGARDVITTSFVNKAWGALPSFVSKTNTSSSNVAISS